MVSRHSPSCCVRLSILLFLAAAFVSPSIAAAIVEGTICDSATLEPIARVTVRVEGLGLSVLGNDDGRYRLRLEPGTYQIRFSHVAHYSRTDTVTIADSAHTHDVYLSPSIIELPGTRVYRRQYDPAQEIIVEAIRRKKELLSKIRDYRFEAYTKVVMRKIKEDRPDEFFLITETQLEGWFQQPDRYKEVITARRQSANLKAENNLLNVGEIFNFNANRIELGRQAVVSPTASDALEFYNYYLLDTILVDGVPAFRLEIEPKNDVHPLFVGEILIADSSYSVAGVDVGFNSAFEILFVSNLRYSQRMARFEADIWMPVEVRFSGDLAFPLPVIPKLTGAYTAVLHNIVFNEGIAPGTFDEYAIEVAPEADNADSASWALKAPVPLTADETAGYRHIDSLKHRPLTASRIAMRVPLLALAALVLPAAHPFFHFNRVEGPYLGAGLTLDDLVPRSELYLGSGWAFDGEYWQHRYRLRTELHQPSRLYAEVSYRDAIVARPTIFHGPGANTTFSSLGFAIDPLDYHLEKGYEVALGFRPIAHFYVRAQYLDVNQYAVANATDYTFFGSDCGDSDSCFEHRANPAIANGRLRSLSASLLYDSRRLLRVKNRDVPTGELPTTLIEVGVEVADPDLIDTDFRYRRYYLDIRRTQLLPGWGTSSFRFFAGGSDRTLPPQRYFTLDHAEAEHAHLGQFKTFDETNFTGDRAAVFYLSHDFGSTLFRRSRLPLIRKIPLSFIIFGGSFWSDFGAASLKAPNDALCVAPDWYSEIGFGLGRVPPLYFNVYFTWQLSAYDTNRFAFSLGMPF